MLQLNNTTQYQAESSLLLDADGRETWVVAVKATFDISNGVAVPADVQEQVCLTDVYHGEPGTSSVKYEGELTLSKPGTDVIVNGHAYAPGGQPVERMEVSISVGKTKKVIRVYGDRTWQESLLGLSTSAPEPFEKMPLLYERAFGGSDVDHEDPEQQGEEPRNPIGLGLWHVCRPSH